jgi:hypothetical protein
MPVLAADEVHLQAKTQLSDGLQSEFVEVLGEIDWLVRAARFVQHSVEQFCVLVEGRSRDVAEHAGREELGRGFALVEPPVALEREEAIANEVTKERACELALAKDIVLCLGHVLDQRGCRDHDAVGQRRHVGHPRLLAHLERLLVDPVGKP